MPLLAYTQSGEPLVAPLMSDAEWEQLRSSTERDAWMPESRRRAVPKVSRLGTRFFAHPPGHAPEGGRESDLHLYLKAECLIGARAAGWDALPEQPGQTPDGQDWRADVLCRRPGQPWSIALEAQVQLKGEEAYRKRQERFAASGIRALCLVAHEPAALHPYWRKPDQHLPAFRTSLWKDQEGRPGVCTDRQDSPIRAALRVVAPCRLRVSLTTRPRRRATSSPCPCSSAAVNAARRCISTSSNEGHGLRDWSISIAVANASCVSSRSSPRAATASFGGDTVPTCSASASRCRSSR